MRVRIEPDVYEDPTAWEALDRLVHLFGTGRHRWDVDDPVAVEESAWLGDIRGSSREQRVLEVLQKSVRALADPLPDRCHTLVCVVGASGLSAQDAADVLEQPAVLVVENEQSDGRFLYALIEAYDRVGLLEALEQRWLELDHAGGYGQMASRVERRLERTRNPGRIQVLADSDRLYPGHQSQTVTKVERIAMDLGVVVHILEKRDSENYLPLVALQRARQQKVYRAFSQRLSDVQRDHYDMKKGFGGALPTAQAALFQDLPSSVVTDLTGGFGPSVGQLWEPYPAGLRQGIDARCRATPGELPGILDLLEGAV